MLDFGSMACGQDQCDGPMGEKRKVDWMVFRLGSGLLIFAWDWSIDLQYQAGGVAVLFSKVLEPIHGQFNHCCELVKWVRFEVRNENAYTFLVKCADAHAFPVHLLVQNGHGCCENVFGVWGQRLENTDAMFSDCPLLSVSSWREEGDCHLLSVSPWREEGDCHLLSVSSWREESDDL